MATGAEILSYKGQAELGTGGSPDLVASRGGNDFSGFQSFMERAMQNQYAWAGMKYQQAIKDRDEVLAMYSQDAIGPDTPLLEDDRAAVQKLIDERTRMLTKTPDIQSNREAWAEVQKKSSEIRGLTAYVKTRYTEAAKQRLEAANEKNPIKKAEMYRHLDAEIRKGPNHLINPHDQQLSWTPNFGLPEPKMLASTSYDPLTFMKTTTQETDLADMTRHFSMEGLVKGENVTFPYEIRSFYEQQSTDPDILSDAVAGQMNARIDQINASKNLKAGDPNFVEHIADNVDGVWVPNKKPVEFAKSWYVYHHYKQFAPVTAPDKEYAELFKVQSEIAENKAQAKAVVMQGEAAKTNASAAAARARTDELNGQALRKKYLAEADEAEARGDKLAVEAANTKRNVSDAVSKTFNLFAAEARTPDKYKPVGDVINFIDPANPGRSASALANVGADNTWKARDLGRQSSDALEMLAKPKYDPETGKYLGKSYPNRVVMLQSPDGDPNKQVLVGLNKDGHIDDAVRPSDGYGRLIIANANFQVDENVNKQLDAARGVAVDVQGSDAAGFDIAGTMNKVATAGSDKAAVGEVRELNGVKYQKTANGWVKYEE